MKAVIAVFNQEITLVRTFSTIVQLETSRRFVSSSSSWWGAAAARSPCSRATAWPAACSGPAPAAAAATPRSCSPSRCPPAWTLAWAEVRIMNCGHFSDYLNSSLETKLSDMKIDYVDCYSTFYLKDTQWVVVSSLNYTSKSSLFPVVQRKYLIE